MLDAASGRGARKYVAWTDAMLSAVANGYRRAEKVDVIALELGVPRNAVVGAARRLGLQHPKATYRRTSNAHDRHLIRLLRAAAREAKDSKQTGRANLLNAAADRIQQLSPE